MTILHRFANAIALHSGPLLHDRIRRSRVTNRCAAEALETRRLLSARIDGFDYAVAGNTFGLEVRYQSDHRLGADEGHVWYGDGVMEPMMVDREAWDADTGRGRFLAWHEFAPAPSPEAQDRVVTFAVGRQGSSIDFRTITIQTTSGDYAEPAPTSAGLINAAPFAGGDAMAASSAPETVGTAPTVTAVYVAGSTWDPSFKTYIASNGLGHATYGYAVPAATQLDELPWTNLNQVSVAFSEDVWVSPSDLLVRGVSVPNYSVTGLAYDSTTKTATWTLGQNLAPYVSTAPSGDNIVLHLTNFITDKDAGNRLDGEWTNPTPPATGADAFPSGDGAADGVFDFRVNALPGDATRDGVVNSLDLSDVHRRLNTTAAANPPDALYSIHHDLNGDGRINADDRSAVDQRRNERLPTTAPIAPVVPTGPSSLSAITVSDKQIDLAWTDVAGETSYTVERNNLGAGHGWTTIGTVPADATFYADTAVVEGMDYYYQVRALSAAGESLPSEIAAAAADYATPTVTQSAAANPAVVPGMMTTLSVGGSLSGWPTREHNLRYTWSVVSKPSGAANPQVAQNGTISAQKTTAMFSKAGSYTLRVEITNGMITASSDVNVTVQQTATTVAVSPLEGRIQHEASQQFTAVVRDQFGHDLSPQPALTWSAEPAGFGNITSGGRYTAPRRDQGGGPVMIRAAAVGASGTAWADVGPNVIIDFDDLAAGTIVTNQYSEATFSADPEYSNYAIPETYTGNASAPNVLGAVADPRPDGPWNSHAYVNNTYISFPTPVNDLKFHKFADNSAAGPIGQVRVFVDGALAATVPIIADGDFYDADVIDLSTHRRVTRIEIVNINDPGGLLWDDFSFSPVGIDVDVDSDNNNGFDPAFPRSFDGNAEDQIEDSTSQPGKLIAVNDDDTDGDGIPDFADGFGLFAGPNYSATANERFVPMVLELPEGVDPAVAKVRFLYDGSDPARVDLGVEDGVYRPAPGSLRIWRKDGGQARSVTQDYVVPSQSVVASALGMGTSRKATFWVEAIAAGAMQADQRIVVQVDADGDGPGQFGSFDGVRVTAFDVDIESTWSDQIQGVAVNSVPGATGYNGTNHTDGSLVSMKDYLFMGTRTDNRLYVKSQFRLTPDLPSIRSILLFRLYTTREQGWVMDDSAASSDGAVGGTIQGNVASMSSLLGQSHFPNQHWPIHVAWGLDDDRNGLLAGPNDGTKREVREIGRDRIEAVDRRMFNFANAELDSLRLAGVGSILYNRPHSRNFLYAFQNDLGLDGAINFVNGTTVQAGEYKLTHNVGALFNAQGSAPINKAVFTPTSGTSSLLRDVAVSPTMLDFIDATLTRHKQTVVDWFAAPANATADEHRFTFASARPEVSFQPDPNQDLFTALGDTVTSGMTISVTVRRQIIDGLQVVSSSAASLGGVMTDLYDFDFDTAHPAPLAAVMQSGFNGGTDRDVAGGRVYKNEIHFSGSAAVSYSYRYA